MRPSATVLTREEARNFSPERNFGAGGAARYLSEAGPAHAGSGELPEFYAHARQMADRFSPRLIVGMGGEAAAFLTAFSVLSGERIQVLSRGLPQALPQDSPGLRLVETNFEDHADLERLEAELPTAEPILFVLPYLLERLTDPRPLLRILRRILRRHPGSRAVLAACERRGEGLADDSAHIRHWTLDEFGSAMRNAGFDLRRIERLRADAAGSDSRTICAELACDGDFYAGFLAGSGLPPAADHLVVTTEHAGTGQPDGIAAYHLNVEQSTGLRRLVLFAGSSGLPENWRDYVRAQGWLHVADIAGRQEATRREISWVDVNEVLAALTQALFLYDEVRLVEYHDFHGTGVRIAQAKRTRLLPPSVTTLCYAHGSSFHWDHAVSAFTTDRDIEMHVRERLALELADCVAFPNAFLRDLYIKEQGLQLRGHVVQPAPYPAIESGDIAPETIDTLVFHGEGAPPKAYADFCEALALFFSRPEHGPAAVRIRRIVLIGDDAPDERLGALKGVELVQGPRTLHDAKALLAQLAPKALAVLPYRGDNQPLALNEIAACGCQMLAFRAGGTPEFLPEALHSSLLCEPKAAALAEGMAKAVRMSPPERAELLQALRRGIEERRSRAAEDYVAFIASLKSGKPAAPAARGAVSVIVPNLNGSAEFLEDVAVGLRSSSYAPAEVFFVDDGSTPENLQLLEEAAGKLAPLHARVLRHSVNQGLSAARNTGLAEARTPYVCAHDNDNILLNHFLDFACRVLDENPEVAAVVTWNRTFEDGEDWRSVNLKAFSYRPLGPDLGLGLLHNIFGDAFAVYRTDVLKRIGGWDASSKAMWEDWQLFARLTALGEQVWVMPKELFLYRVRSNSMLRTYPEFAGRLRLARALEGLPRSQALSVMQAMHFPSPEIRTQMARLNGTIESLQHHRAERDALAAQLDTIMNSTSWKITSPLRHMLGSFPNVRAGMRKGLKLVWWTVTLQLPGKLRGKRRNAV